PFSKFDGKADKGFLVGYSISSKAFRVFNSRTIIVQETLHINFLENQPNVAVSRPTWLFDIDTLTQYMNYQPVVEGNQPNSSALSRPTWLFDIDTLTQYMNYQPVVEGNQPNSSACIQEHFDADPHNTDADATFEVKEPDTNGVNVSSTPIIVVEPNSTNSTNTFSAACPSNNDGNPQHALKDKGVIDIGCSRHMTWNISYLSDFEEINRGYVAFGKNPKGGKIIGDFTCLFEKATLNESNLWHRRLGHINFKTMNKLVKENQINLKVKIIRSNNGTEFKNQDLNQFCRVKGIKREFSVARTPQQNRIAERKNRTLIEAARTVLADSLLPIPF
nr:putative ribonuclease H-like domain-containing protein [Tanacetum cinerariifolium]